MRWLASRPPPKSRQSSPTKLSTACSTGSVETASECDSSDPAAEVLMVNGPRSPPGSPASTTVMAEAIRRVPTRSTAPSPSLRSRGKSFAAVTWMHFTLLSLEKPPRPGPWRRCAWPTWLSALDWRISSTHSTSVLGSGFLSPVDDSFFRLQLRYTELRFRISQLQPE